MGCEVELKAHLDSSEVENLISKIRQLSGVVDLGLIDKYDVYWSKTPEGEPVFRTRKEKTSDGERVLFTCKPLKSKDYTTEYNQENEFFAPVSQWDDIINFAKALSLHVCRLKFKSGYHFLIKINDFEIHCEVLNVKFIGWFVEAEICGESLETMDKEGADNALFRLLDILSISKERIEVKGYNKMLKECGHERG